jgi:integrase
MPTLSAKTIAALVPPTAPGADIIYWDESLRGFGYRLRVGAGGKLLRSFVAQYKRSGATRRMTLDASGALSVDQARARAREILAEVALGRDPQADKTERREKDLSTMRALVGQYLDARKTEVRPRTLTVITKFLTDPRYFGDLHGKPLDQIKRRDAAACLARIKARGPAHAKNARATLSGFFRWCMAEGFADDDWSNPVAGTNKIVTNGARERVLTDAELAAVWRACDDASEHDVITKLLILTGCRRVEVGGMRWSEIALGHWTIPEERSKNHRAHVLPILPAMRKILDARPRVADRDQLFGARSAAGFNRWSQLKPALDKASGVTGWTLHDLRRTVATGMSKLGVQPHVVEAVLNHYSGHRKGVAGTYNRNPYSAEIKAALTAWHAHVRKLASRKD